MYSFLRFATCATVIVLPAISSALVTPSPAAAHEACATLGSNPFTLLIQSGGGSTFDGTYFGVTNDGGSANEYLMADYTLSNAATFTLNSARNMVLSQEVNGESDVVLQYPLPGKQHYNTYPRFLFFPYYSGGYHGRATPNCYVSPDCVWRCAHREGDLDFNVTSVTGSGVVELGSGNGTGSYYPTIVAVPVPAS